MTSSLPATSDATGATDATQAADAAGAPSATASTSAGHGERDVLVASSHGPVAFHRDDEGSLRPVHRDGALAAGLAAVPSSATPLWVCTALSDDDRAAARAARDGRLDLAGYDLGPVPVRMLDLEALTFSRAYNGVANSVLWFVHHLLYDAARTPIFDSQFRRDWLAYVDYNAAFAEAIAEEAAPGAHVVVQDYHLALVPELVREHRADLSIAHFSHTPWAPPDYFRMLPDDVAVAILEGVLAADHVGFLTQRWARAFVDCCETVLDARVEDGSNTIEYAGRRSSVGVHPLGVDADAVRQRAEQSDVRARMHTLRGLVGGRRLILRSDRTELPRNIVRGLAAYRDLLRRHPEWHGRVVHLVLAPPSPHALPAYQEYVADVHRMAQTIIDEFGSPDWDPLVLAVDEDWARTLAAYRMADVAIVNPVRDGDSRVAKQLPLLSERGCALVLSRDSGAAAELGEHALLINPFDVEATGEALHQALSMRGEERSKRSAGLVSAASAHPPEQWFADLLAAVGDSLDR